MSYFAGLPAAHHRVPGRIAPLAITACTATSALGRGLKAHARALWEQRSGLRPNDFTCEPLPCWIGRVDGIEATTLPTALASLDSRNHRLAWLGLSEDGFADAAAAAIERHGADRVALVVGTSTASIGATEAAYANLEDGRFPAALDDPRLHAPHSLGLFLEAVLGSRGPCLTVSTACSSSAKIFAVGERLLRCGVADAVILGGVDSLCGSVLYGFASLELLSPEPCRPFAAERRGLSLGEAAGFALLERDGPSAAPRLLGYGESSDAYHMSSPHPEGLGARRAIEDALARAGLTADAVDYVNLHGTATAKNDAVEARVISALFGSSTRASSTKAWTGHCLGAAGILEAALSLIAIREGLVPGGLDVDAPDPACTPSFAFANESRALRVVLSNSFGFGGNNCTLIFAGGAAGGSA